CRLQLHGVSRGLRRTNHDDAGETRRHRFPLCLVLGAGVHHHADVGVTVMMSRCCRVARGPLRAAAAIAIATVASAVAFDASGESNSVEAGYDGRVPFVRLRWQSDFGFSRRGGFSSAWNHDYPRAEQHLSLIIKELTAINIRRS